MEETFEIPVLYKGEELSFPAKLLIFGYTYKIQVNIKGYEILFEPDEERNYRAVINNIENINESKIDFQILKAIAEAIEAIVK